MAAIAELQLGCVRGGDDALTLLLGTAAVAREAGAGGVTAVRAGGEGEGEDHDAANQRVTR